MEQIFFGKFFKIESRDSLYYSCSNPSYENIRFPLEQNNIDYLTNRFDSSFIYASKVPGSNISQKIIFIMPRHSNSSYGKKLKKYLYLIIR
ncbi:MAG: hypothetical protein OMM_12131 [Candidatus Magnetoglobus multicellularis str. Araruama]|uniref:Uncharacterized protein n=1 Tax=Candidatus Magnetoglobus multicellularis str. Araruama TaxID=890399 RepID=A0A1V1NWK1_9BACT|nr:MAG: hypothetical protein OMM_12131 [Candidatus Magnetoglobus multicellularis str. Araruama]